MPANAAIYLPYPHVDLSSVFRNAKSDGNASTTSTYFDVLLGDDVVRFNVMEPHHVKPHIEGFRRYIASLNQNEQRKSDTSSAISQTQVVLGLMTDREFQDNPAIWNSLFQIANAYQGYVFVYNSVLARDGTVLVGPLLDDEAQPPTIVQEANRETIEANVSLEALERKERSEMILRAEEVPIHKSLPVIETEKEARHRSKEEIAYRTLALLVVALKGEGLEQPHVEKAIKDYAINAYFSPKERVFVQSPLPSEHDRIQFVWRYEAAWVMLWALGYVEELEKPSAICDVPRAVKLMHERNTLQFIEDAKLRSMHEILDQADRIYRYHWAVVDARVNGKKVPAMLDPGVTMERHYALNWLIGYMEQEWDDISTDT